MHRPNPTARRPLFAALGTALLAPAVVPAAAHTRHLAVGTGTSGTSSRFLRLTPALRPTAGTSSFVFALPTD